MYMVCVCNTYIYINETKIEKLKTQIEIFT